MLRWGGWEAWLLEEPVMPTLVFYEHDQYHKMISLSRLREIVKLIVYL
jgi:hypothetical protein